MRIHKRRDKRQPRPVVKRRRVRDKRQWGNIVKKRMNRVKVILIYLGSSSRHIYATAVVAAGVATAGAAGALVSPFTSVCVQSREM